MLNRSSWFLLTLLAAPSLAQQAPSADILIEDWKVIGPFSTGSREGFVHPLADDSGRIPSSFTFQESHPSLLPDGGRAVWRTPEPHHDDAGAPTGRIPFDFPEVDWEARNSEWGGAGVRNVAFAFGTFELEADQLLLLDSERTSATINGVPHLGDPYHHHIARSVVRGLAGRNMVLARSTGYGGERTRPLRLLRITPAMGKVLIVEKDVMLPEMVVGRAGEGFVGVPLLNLTEDWIEGIEIEVSGSGVNGRATVPFALAPLAAMKVPVAIRWPAPPAPSRGPERLPLSVRVSAAGGASTVELGARVKTPEEPRRQSFLSRADRSAQLYVVREPVGGPAPERDGLIMSLHGAGAFGTTHGGIDWAWCVGATNRRRFGFDWHDYGRLDFEEVTELALATLPVDPDRVAVEGHSMGGHGCWVMGVHHADWWASVTPSAAWVGYDFYLPFTARRSKAFAPPELDSMNLRSLAPGRVSLFLENLHDVPVRVFAGSRDDNVPPVQARILAGALERKGFDVELCEAPDQKHWGHRGMRRMEAKGCIDHEAFDAYQSSARRKPDPRHVVFVTTDPDIDPDHYWVEILAQRRIATETRVEATIVGADVIEVATRNVTAFALDLGPRLTRAGIELAPKVAVRLGEREIMVRPREGRTRFVFQRRSSGWSARATPKVPADTYFPNRRPGGLAKSLFRPFLLVVGTRAEGDGSAARQESHLHLARTLAQMWWRRANGLAPIVRDVDLTEEMRASHDLVLIGSQELNHETRAIARGLNIVVKPGGVFLAGGRVPGPALASVHWQPDPRDAERRVLVFQATTSEADDLLPLLNPIPPGSGLPDYVIATPAVRSKSWGGFAAAGFWTPDFKFDPSNGWLASD